MIALASTTVGGAVGFAHRNSPDVAVPFALVPVQVPEEPQRPGEPHRRSPPSPSLHQAIAWRSSRFSCSVSSRPSHSSCRRPLRCGSAPFCQRQEPRGVPAHATLFRFARLFELLPRRTALPAPASCSAPSLPRSPPPPPAICLPGSRADPAPAPLRPSSRSTPLRRPPESHLPRTPIAARVTPAPARRATRSSTRSPPAASGGAAAPCGPARGQQPQGSSSLGDLLDRERPHPRRRQLYRERYPVQLAAQPCHRQSVLLGRARSPACRPRPLDEQAHRLVAGQLSRGRRRWGSGRESAGTIHSVSPAMPRGSRLVARIRAPGTPAAGSRRARRTLPRGARSCPEPVGLFLDFRCSTSTSVSERSATSRTPSAEASAPGTSLGSESEASSTHHTPSSNPSTRSCATAKANRVLPHPPGPQSVARRVADQFFSIASSRSRPTKLVNSSGRLFGGRACSGIPPNSATWSKSARGLLPRRLWPVPHAGRYPEPALCPFGEL